jgi:hypothetical protein
VTRIHAALAAKQNHRLHQAERRGLTMRILVVEDERQWPVTPIRSKSAPAGSAPRCRRQHRMLVRSSLQ